jgi:hypothetical protein
LNLCDCGKGEYKKFKIPLENCADPNAYIEVFLRGKPTPQKDPILTSESSVFSPSDSIAAGAVPDPIY